NSQCELIDMQAFYCCNIKAVTIPASVKVIEDNAFAFNHNLMELTFESNSQLTTIGSYAFQGSKFAEITLPASLAELDPTALNGCHFNKIRVEEGNQHYKVIDGILYTMDGKTLICYSKEAGENIVIPEGVTTINDGAFLGSDVLYVQLPSTLKVIASDAFRGSYISSMTLPEGLTTIGSGAFIDTQLTEIVIPSTVTEIGSSAFLSAWYLESITILGNPAIGSNVFNGTVFYDDESNWENETLYIGTCLVNVRDLQTTITVKDGTTSIAGGAFYYEYSENINTTTIIIPDSVTVIGEYTFYNIPNITDIYFTGTEEQWNNININGYNPFLDVPNVTVHFNYVI
ncbi:MAG: leucine-rich repeat protein, partial [Clostridia bacterium]|nr:leucine-rich repeat protein [Clostridia bacterium]